jgi:hypothetical protein
VQLEPSEPKLHLVTALAPQRCKELSLNSEENSSSSLHVSIPQAENDGDITLMAAKLGKICFVTDTEENILYVIPDEF